MISNTVIVFLRDLLPLFILYSYVSALQFKTIQKNRLFWTKLTLVSFLFTVLLFSFIEEISETFDGTGIEVIKSISVVVMWTSLSLGAVIHDRASGRMVALLFSIGIVIFTAFNGAEFLIYFGAFGQSVDNLLPIFLGCVMGIGICLSFSLLLKFLLIELKRSRGYWLFTVLWSAFLAGQLSQIIGLLSQVNLINEGLPLFTSRVFIDDASEYGHVLNALIGYESSPSIAFLSLYTAALCFPILCKLLIDKSSPFLLIGGTKK